MARDAVSDPQKPREQEQWPEGFSLLSSSTRTASRAGHSVPGHGERAGPRLPESLGVPAYPVGLSLGEGS